MTRFARAHGSKSSNERLPEAATSWNVMKQQLKEKLQSSESLSDSAVSSQKIWKTSDFDKDVWNKNEVQWADLEDSECADKAVKSGDKYYKPGKKKNNKKHKTLPNEYFPQTTGDNHKKRKRREIDSAEFHDTHFTGTELATPNGILPYINSAKKIKKMKKVKQGANNDVNDVSDINLDKQTVITTIDTEDNVCLTNKQKTKQRQRTHSVTYEVSEETIYEGNGTSADFTMENNTKKKLGKKRKKSHDSISAIDDEQPTREYGSGLKRKKKVNLGKCVASDASNHQLKKKHKYSKNKNSVEENGCLNSVKQNFPEEDTETITGADAGVVLSEKTKKKKKIKRKRDDNAGKGVDGSLNRDKLNFQFEGSGCHARINSDLLKEEREKRTKDVSQQENNKKFMKKHKFTVENKKIKKENKYLHTTILHMNGKDIEIMKFEGFPVKKEDAENLIQLKKKMIAKGIPKSEINATLKLERRKAEKALAREKKKVCFHCRKSGHVLSECPELGKADTDDPVGTGICFKCGSTEHKHFECRVTREQEFRYAKCFICNEQGHIARQCPDNPRGLYPKGGACHICGDVTHLKKDCPDLIKEKEEKIIKLQTLSNKALEALENEKSAKSVSPNNVKKRRTVKF